MYNLIPTATTEKVIQRDTFKNTTDKSKWNLKKSYSTHGQAEKIKQRNEIQKGCNIAGVPDTQDTEIWFLPVLRRRYLGPACLRTIVKNENDEEPHGTGVNGAKVLT